MTRLKTRAEDPELPRVVGLSTAVLPRQEVRPRRDVPGLGQELGPCAARTKGKKPWGFCIEDAANFKECV